MVHYNSFYYVCTSYIWFTLLIFLEDGLHNDTITEQDLFGQNSLFLHPEETFASSDVIKQFSTAALSPGTYVYIYAKQKHLGCKKVRGQSEATLHTGRRDQKV